MKPTRLIALLLIAAILGLAAPGAFAKAKDVPKTHSTAGASPTQVVQNFYDALTGVMKDGTSLGFSGRYKELAPAIKTTFNLPLMTRFAVGPVWTQASAGQQQQLVSAFSDFSIATYASRFTKYNGEQFEVKDEKPSSDGAVIVETSLQPGGNDQPVMLNYLMRKDDKGSWRIVDVFLDGSISELATRRSEFTSIVNRDGIPALVNQLGEKSRQLGPS